MSRSPIEMMIDKACVYEPPSAPVEKIALRCPKCKKEQWVAGDNTDPIGTAVLVIQCPECVGGDFDSPEYFDAAGNQLQLGD